MVTFVKICLISYVLHNAIKAASVKVSSVKVTSVKVGSHHFAIQRNSR